MLSYDVGLADLDGYITERIQSIATTKLRVIHRKLEKGCSPYWAEVSSSVRFGISGTMTCCVSHITAIQ